MSMIKWETNFNLLQLKQLAGYVVRLIVEMIE